jgi:hypothetical protein
MGGQFKQPSQTGFEEKKKSKWRIWVIVIIVVIGLGIGVYLFVHSLKPDIMDTDEKDIYQKGFIYERTLWGWNVLVGDGCGSKENSFSGSTHVLEKHLWDDEGETKFDDRVSFDSTLFECPNGCEEGACIR